MWDIRRKDATTEEVWDDAKCDYKAYKDDKEAYCGSSNDGRVEAEVSDEYDWCRDDNRRDGSHGRDDCCCRLDGIR